MTSLRRFALLTPLVAALIGGPQTEARAEVVVIVSARSPVNTLSRQQVSNIFLGRAHTFPDGSPAIPVDLQNGTDLRDEFSEKVHGIASSQLNAYWSRMVFTGKGNPPREAIPPEIAVKLTAANPRLISYVDRSWVDGSVKVILVP
ncbi:phosphate ABC transporter substrate-binding protein [Aquabacterium sp.]|uniref:phosphate ABC transporter substrate-binding protein n=1 Tax=Aquabacterium sp. TaxID=1872578 RepID=UPI002E33C577|nr:phosphate ABC transporter substrate-binding protein [Aquabacterium sp.]HEX5310761.1 phosphate ABC transporter substrate-binding protein [Aquabacterium sp.]